MDSITSLGIPSNGIHPKLTFCPKGSPAWGSLPGDKVKSMPRREKKSLGNRSSGNEMSFMVLPTPMVDFSSLLLLWGDGKLSLCCAGFRMPSRELLLHPWKAAQGVLPWADTSRAGRGSPTSTGQMFCTWQPQNRFQLNPKPNSAAPASSPKCKFFQADDIDMH